jgi:16S rRNA (guanine527-N7)-methyltransferase
MFILENAAIQGILMPYGVSASESLCDQIRAYSDLLLRWNQKIALTTITDSAEIVRFHFGESLFAASLLAPLRGRLADFGSGAGFPGLALKLITPALHVILVESNVKKTTFLSEVVRALEIQGVEIFRGRTEQYPLSRDSFDFVTARAVGAHERVLVWASRRLVAGGQIAFWVNGEDAKEMSGAHGWTWQPPRLIPQTKNRYILAGRVQK